MSINLSASNSASLFTRTSDLISEISKADALVAKLAKSLFLLIAIIEDSALIVTNSFRKVEKLTVKQLLVSKLKEVKDSAQDFAKKNPTIVKIAASSLVLGVAYAYRSYSSAPTQETSENTDIPIQTSEPLYLDKDGMCVLDSNKNNVCRVSNIAFTTEANLKNVANNVNSGTSVNTDIPIQTSEPLYLDKDGMCFLDSNENGICRVSNIAFTTEANCIAKKETLAGLPTPGISEQVSEPLYFDNDGMCALDSNENGVCRVSDITSTTEANCIAKKETLAGILTPGISKQVSEPLYFDKDEMRVLDSSENAVYDIFDLEKIKKGFFTRTLPVAVILGVVYVIFDEIFTNLKTKRFNDLVEKERASIEAELRESRELRAAREKVEVLEPGAALKAAIEDIIELEKATRAFLSSRILKAVAARVEEEEIQIVEQIERIERTIEETREYTTKLLLKISKVSLEISKESVETVETGTYNLRRALAKLKQASDLDIQQLSEKKAEIEKVKKNLENLGINGRLLKVAKAVAEKLEKTQVSLEKIVKKAELRIAERKAARKPEGEDVLAGIKLIRKEVRDKTIAEMQEAMDYAIVVIEAVEMAAGNAESRARAEETRGATIEEVCVAARAEVVKVEFEKTALVKEERKKEIIAEISEAARAAIAKAKKDNKLITRSKLKEEIEKRLGIQEIIEAARTAFEKAKKESEVVRVEELREKGAIAINTMLGTMQARAVQVERNARAIR